MGNDDPWRRCLDARLHSLFEDTGIQQLSRVALPRLEKNAFPNIGILELVSGKTFKDSYQSLYESMFHGGERERSDLIIKRLEDDFAGRRTGLAPYRIVGVRAPPSAPDEEGEAIGAAQFSVLMLRGGKYAVPYLQYIYIRPQNRRHDLSEVLHTLVLAIANADAKAWVTREDGERTVPFTLFETEPPNHGTELANRSKATERIGIHTKSGSRAVMLSSRSTSEGALVIATEGIVSAHVQPGLEPEDEPLTLIWAVRPSPSPSPHQNGETTTYDINKLGPALLTAYYQSLRDEGFPEKNIAFAERIAAKRCEGRRFVEIPLADVSANMYMNLEPDSSHHSTTRGI